MDVDTALDTLARAAGDEPESFMGQPRPGDERISRAAVRRAALIVAGDQMLKDHDVTGDEDVERLADMALGVLFTTVTAAAAGADAPAGEHGTGGSVPGYGTYDWRPQGPVIRPFQPPAGPYGAGHRAGSISPCPWARQCAPPPRAWWRSPGSWQGSGSCRSITPTASGPNAWTPIA